MIKKVLFNDEAVISPQTIKTKIARFRYIDASEKIIKDSRTLDKEGTVFLKNASLILSNFGMTRGGRFRDPVERREILQACWRKVGDSVFSIHYSVINNGGSKDRFLLEIDSQKREEVADKIWSITKELLPFTMGEYTYGLVGASKILFSVLPEIVLPTDNRQYLQLFQTVDLGDIIREMASEIQLWEEDTGEKLNEMDNSRRLTTLPSVYNVMAMDARPKE